MQDDIASIRSDLWKRMRKRTTRDNFVAANISTGIAAQLVTMREARDWQSQQVAEKAGMAPARISVMENPSYDKFSLSTLKRLASAFDVALVVRFVPFSELVDWIAGLSPEKLNAVSFDKDSINLVQTDHAQADNIIKLEDFELSDVKLPHLAGVEVNANQTYDNPQAEQQALAG